MKLTSIEIHPENSSDVVTLSFRDPKNTKRYNVKEITGLDADTLDQRLVVMRIGLNPSFRSYSDLRDILYKMIASSRTGRVQLRFLNGLSVIAVTSGFVSKLEAPHFGKVPEVVLTVQCDDPRLKAFTPVSESVSGLDLSNVNISDDESTAPHGFIFELGITADISDISIIAPADPTWSFEVVPSGGFTLGDELYFSSEVNNKYLYIIRGGTTINLADVILPGSIWPLIFPGNNIFTFSNATHLRLDALSYYPTYWGV